MIGSIDPQNVAGDFAPSKHPALIFLNALDPVLTATFNIETFTDVPKGGRRPKPDPLCRRYPNLSLDMVADIIPELEDLNAHGAAIYVAVNQCEGQRTKATVTRIRGVHADFDGAPPEKLEAVRARLQPTIEVQSSTPDRRHFYWLLSDGETMSVEIAETINRGLVELGADPAATDASRLLRLPSFRHVKFRQVAEQIIENSVGSEDLCPLTTVISFGPRYTAAQIEAALPKAKPKAKAKRQSPLLAAFKSIPDTPRQRAVLAQATSYISADCDYDVYCDIVWAHLSLGWHDAEDIAKQWCQTAPHRYEEAHFNQLVASYDVTKTPTVGTIIHHARLGGWDG